LSTDRPRGVIRGSGRRGTPRKFDQAVSVRMDTPTLARIRELAEADGTDVSTWIRNAASAAVLKASVPAAPPGYRVAGWKCEHVSMTAGNAVLYEVSAGCGCEMQPIYEPVPAAA